MLGSTQKILVEGFSAKSTKELYGRADNNKIVNFATKDNLIGEFVNLLTEVRTNTFMEKSSRDKYEIKNKIELAEKITSKNLTLKPQDNSRLAKLCGTLDENLRQIESYMQVEISNRGNNFIIKAAKIVFQKLQI